jgi:hypothetical protein
MLGVPAVTAIQLDCPDDNAAIESAKQFINGRDIELWQRDRLIARFGSRPKDTMGQLRGELKPAGLQCRRLLGTFFVSVQGRQEAWQRNVFPLVRIIFDRNRATALRKVLDPHDVGAHFPGSKGIRKARVRMHEMRPGSDQHGSSGPAQIECRRLARW